MDHAGRQPADSRPGNTVVIDLIPRAVSLPQVQSPYRKGPYTVMAAWLPLPPEAGGLAGEPGAAGHRLDGDADSGPGGSGLDGRELARLRAR
jgi:hypothetical protein